MRTRTLKSAVLTFCFSFSVAALNAQIPATGLCNTGLTPASPLPEGCTTSVFVAPLNSEYGGTSVDGNWQLATPYPSASYTAQAPDPCSVSVFGPAWVDVPSGAWLPVDGLSQWISPKVNGPYTTAGWFIYRTQVPVPFAKSEERAYLLTAKGRVSADNFAGGVFVGDGNTCIAKALPPLVGYDAWGAFDFTATVTPGSHPYLYFQVYNSSAPGENATGFRVEFTSAYFLPE